MQAELAGWIDARFIQLPRPPGGQDDVGGQEHVDGVARDLDPSPVQSHDAGDLPGVAGTDGEQMGRLLVVEHADIVLFHLSLQAFAHEPARFRPGAGGPLGGVVVRLVAYERAQRICREGHAGADQMVEFTERVDPLGQRQVTVAGPPGAERLGECFGAVRYIRARAELVVGLFVRSAHS